MWRTRGFGFAAFLAPIGRRGGACFAALRRALAWAAFFFGAALVRAAGLAFAAAGLGFAAGLAAAGLAAAGFVATGFAAAGFAAGFVATGLAAGLAAGLVVGWAAAATAVWWAGLAAGLAAGFAAAGAAGCAAAFTTAFFLGAFTGRFEKEGVGRRGGCAGAAEASVPGAAAPSSPAASVLRLRRGLIGACSM
ncbi:MAG: hypothetical protein EXR95_03155 [Gemmatimonadetes bacterium]|nr:hypothetical protein [Gemmatimonadota bacterium]